MLEGADGLRDVRDRSTTDPLFDAMRTHDDEDLIATAAHAIVSAGA